MKKICFAMILSCMIFMQGMAQTITQTKQGVSVKFDDAEIHIDYYSPAIVRIVKTPAGHAFKKESLSVIKKPESVKTTVVNTGDFLELSTGKLKVALDLKSEALTFYDAAGKVLMAEKPGSASFTEFNDAGTKTFSVKQGFALEPEEAIYGLGILQNNKMSQRNQEVYMVQNNTWDFVTFFQSVKGYGLFWDNYSPTVFKDDKSETSFSSEVGEGIDYYFMVGGNADGVVAEMRDLTGQVPMFPLWSYGFFQSKERYKSQFETVGVVKKYRELGVPLDGIVQDWQYWGNNYLWNAMEFLSDDFPDGKGMIDEIHSMNAKIMISIWASFGPATKQYRELQKINGLYSFNTWPESGLTAWPPNMDYPSGVRVYDAFNPKAREIYWKHLKEGLFDLGIDAWWMDSTEPDHLSARPEDLDNPTYLGSFRKVRNAFPLVTVGGVYDNQRAVSSDKRVLVLTRSAFAGQQRYGASVWSGDVFTTWDNFRRQVPAGLNFSLTGIPHWNSDIGGFFAGAYNRSWNDGSGAKNPLFQEIFVRWMQFAVFTPMMRSHGTDVPREIYQYGSKGEPIYDALEKAINLRYALLPYIYSTAWEVTDKQASFMRALVMDFAHDKKVWDLPYEYMFGRSILVAPVVYAQYTPENIDDAKTEEGWNRVGGKFDAENIDVDFTAAKSYNVYLPAGANWYDYYSNVIFEGGREITVETTIDKIPFYIKAGSIIPIGPKVQYAEEKLWDELEIRVYEGADAEFVLYEDEGDNYNYEKGVYSTIRFFWDDSKKELTIDTRKGEFPGMLAKRKFSIVRINPATASDSKTGVDKVVSYSGKKLKVKF